MRSEFQFINDMKSRHGLNRVGDDCAVLPKDDKTDLLITSDMLVERVDFRLEWATPEQIGHKALAVSLSDIAAMGGTPKYAMLSIAVVENLWKGDFLDRLYAGWHRLGENFDVELIGGDVSRTSGPLTIDSTVLGEVPNGKAILRSNARSGDGIYVIGTLGGAAGALSLLLDGLGTSETASLIEKQLQPQPEINCGKYLSEHGLANALIDISDGLSSDLGHICDASGVGAEIDLDAIPVDPGILKFFDPTASLEMALHGGEDFALLFTTGDQRAADLPHTTFIGRVTPNVGVIEGISGNTRRRIEPEGYRHF